VEQPAGDLNALVIAGERMLLVETAGGTAVHLAAETPEGEGRPAVPDAWLRSETLGYVADIASYDRQELESTRWSTRSLCGREWTAMAAGDGGPLYRDQPIQYAPTCRRCLASLDRRFPVPSPDERVELVVELAARAVEEHGSAEIIGVPGDQVASLRTELRRLFRQRFGHAGKTWLVNDLLLVTCDQATEQVRLAERQEVVRSLYQGAITVPVDDSGWRIHWHAWR
jgi:hypothetical protein